MKSNSNKKKENMITKGLRLKECREEKHLTQADVAEILNCSNNHVSMIERGERNLTYENAKILSEYFNVSIGYLLCVNLYKTSEEEKYFIMLSDSDEEMLFREFLKFKSIGISTYFKGIDDPLETKRLNLFLKNNFKCIDDPYEQTCLVELEDGTIKPYEVDYIKITDHSINGQTHIIDKDTYNELKEDIDNYIHHKIMELSTINKRKQKLLRKSNTASNFYKNMENLIKER